MEEREYTMKDVEINYNNLKDAIQEKDFDQINYYADELKEIALCALSDADDMEDAIYENAKRFSEKLEMAIDDLGWLKKEIDELKD